MGSRVQGLQYWGLVSSSNCKIVVAYRRTYFRACGNILFWDDPCLPHWQGYSLPLSYESPRFQGFLFFLFLFHFFFLNWGRKDWQYCAGLTIQYSIRCTEPDSVIHMHLVILSGIYFRGYYTAEYSWVPCPYIRCLLMICVIHIHWCLHVSPKLLKYTSFWPFPLLSISWVHDSESVSEVISFLLMLKFHPWVISYAHCLSLTDWLTKCDHV